MAEQDRIVEQVQMANDIIDVVSGYIPLKRAGRNFKACCPFHQEKTPSFMVSPDKQIFHCFGCGAGGDVFSFLMKYEQLTFPEALQRLAERAHIKLPERKTGSTESRSEKDSLYQVYQEAAQFYYQNLMKSPAGKRAREYLSGRKFGSAEAERFKLGYASSGWQELYDHLKQKNFAEKILFQSGLIARSQKNGQPFDLFRDRVMFPIFNANGKVIALGGRIMGQGEPKYLNSPESAIFRKRRELYGLHAAKRASALAGGIRRIMIVEGYLDCIRLHMNGFENAVATLGTSLTEEHVQILKRYADEAIVVFDGDKAGEQASLRGLDIFLEQGMNVKVLGMPKGEDPDSLIQTRGRETMETLLSESQDVFDFKLGVLLKRYDRADSMGLLKITGEFLDSFIKIQNQVLLDRYLKKLALNLGVAEASLREELKKLQNKYKRRPEAGTVMNESISRGLPSHKEPNHERLLASLIFQNPRYLGQLKQTFPDFSFSGDQLQALTQHLETYLGEVGVNQYQFVRLMARIQDDQLKSYAAALTAEGLDHEPDRDRAFQDCLSKLREENRQSKLKSLQREIAKAEQKGDQALIAKAVKVYQDYLSSSRP